LNFYNQIEKWIKAKIEGIKLQMIAKIDGSYFTEEDIS
jgi:hypothetical protein